MTNLNRYRSVLMDTLKLTEQEVTAIENQPKGCWDSFSQMNLIAAMEQTFSIECTLDDMADFVSYNAGIEILKRHGIDPLA